MFLALKETTQPAQQTRREKLAKTKSGDLLVELICQFLDCYNLQHTKAVLVPEMGLEDMPLRSNEKLAAAIGLEDSPSSEPLLLALLNRTVFSSSASAAACREQLSPDQQRQARAKFDAYDGDGNGVIDKGELRTLLMDLFPQFHPNMLERYVNDEFRATDRDFSNCRW